jgi:tetratricopeptide (TPR) repeat protein
MIRFLRASRAFALPLVLFVAQDGRAAQVDPSAQPQANQQAQGTTDPAQSGAPQAVGVPPQPANQGSSVDREKMWFAPTAEDWKKPCLITWQRSWEDAVKVSRQTKKPILICVNMDGEIASEHYAGVRYRRPETASLYEPYVCVIASVYRHTPSDYDENGERVLCPRFGSVTCGEHIAIEPALYDQFFDGQRVAPRHIMVELDKSETYDVYYAWDTDSVFQAIRTGIEERKIQPLEPPGADRSLEERIASRDVADRKAVETAYVQGTPEVRRRLLESATVHKDLDQVDLLRLALFGFDVELAKLARQTLAQSDSEKAIDLITEVLRSPLDPAERELLLGALQRLGEKWPRAGRLASVFQSLEGRSQALDQERWKAGLGEVDTAQAAGEWRALGARIDYQAEAARSRPGDAAAQLELAESFLALAVDPETSRVRGDPVGPTRDTVDKYHQLLIEDAGRSALEAEKLGAKGWRVNAAIGLSAYYLKDVKTAYARAEAAMADLPAGDESWNAMAVLALFAEARRDAISQAIRDKQPWPKEWLADVHSAYSVLAKHPLGTDQLVAAHYDFLSAVGAYNPAARALDEGLERFPDSWTLHDRMRSRLLRERGASGMESAYEDWLKGDHVGSNLEWFAGYTSLVAAEFHRRASKDEEARASYERAIAHYEHSIEANPSSAASSAHYIALAFAGRARLELDANDYPAALADLIASFEKSPSSAGTLDGLNVSAVTTAYTLRARLTESGDDERLTKLQGALDRLDPELLQLPAFERDGGRGPSPDAQRFSERRGRRNG